MAAKPETQTISFVIEVAVPVDDPNAGDVEWFADACTGALKTFYGYSATWDVK